MTDESNILTIEDLTKSYASGFKFGPLSASFIGGEVVAFLGANGAGKSTFFQAISGNHDATTGQCLIHGKKMHPEAHELKRSVGYLPQDFVLPKWVTGKEILRYASGLFELSDSSKKIQERMEYWDCESYQNRPLESCSHGMQKRIALSLATLHDPAILILDEPFSGLDLFHIRNLKNEILKRRDAGKLTILSTHIAPYVASLCGRVYLVKSGTVSMLKDWSQHDELKKIKMIEDFFFTEQNG